MQRRTFLATALYTFAWSVEATAQHASKLPRIGFLGLGQPAEWKEQIDALRSGLKRFGYRDGGNISFEFRWASDIDQLRDYARQLVHMNVDIIIAPASTQVELPSKPLRQSRSCSLSMPTP